MRFQFAAPLLALACLSSTAQAQIIKCIKPDGSMELSDRPCASGKNSIVPVGPTNVMDGSHYRRMAVEQRIRAQQEEARERAYAAEAAHQRQQAAEAVEVRADRELRQKLLEAHAKAQSGARRAERQEAAALQATQAAEAATVNAGSQRITDCNSQGCRDTSGRYYDHANNNRYWSNGQMCRERNGRMHC